MNVFYFEVTNQRITNTVAIFAKSAENASVISGPLMHNIECLEPQNNGLGLALFRKSGKPQQLINALASALHEGLAGYTLEGGWTVVEV